MTDPHALHAAKGQGYRDRRWGKPRTAVALFLEQRCDRYDGDALEALAHEWLRGFDECDAMLRRWEEGQKRKPTHYRQR